jgi:hypothetical protein
MTEHAKPQGGDVFIVDNSDQDWKVRRYLHDWTEIANSFDIATGYFEIGALLLLDQQWQKLGHVRILMGDEVSRRTKKALSAGLEEIKKKLDGSIESEKEKNDFLTGVPAIVDHFLWPTDGTCFPSCWSGCRQLVRYGAGDESVPEGTSRDISDCRRSQRENRF